MANTNKNGALEAVAEREMIFADCSQSRAYANLECGVGCWLPPEGGVDQRG